MLLQTYALSLIGTPYFYGGDDPISGFDCSGLACELARAAGIVARNFRSNAQGLHNELVKTGCTPIAPKLGDFSFYGPSWDKIDHVGFCLDGVTMVEAGGGDATTLDPKTASNQNAFVRLRPIRFRKDYLGIVRPTYT